MFIFKNYYFSNIIYIILNMSILYFFIFKTLKLKNENIHSFLQKFCHLATIVLNHNKKTIEIN